MHKCQKSLCKLFCVKVPNSGKQAVCWLVVHECTSCVKGISLHTLRCVGIGICCGNRIPAKLSGIRKLICHQVNSHLMKFLSLFSNRRRGSEDLLTFIYKVRWVMIKKISISENVMTWKLIYVMLNGVRNTSCIWEITFSLKVCNIFKIFKKIPNVLYKDLLLMHIKAC